MKLIKTILLCLVGALWMLDASAQPANASINIQTQNGGQVAVGNTVDILVVVTNTGPNPILGFRVRARINVPTALATILPTAQQTGLPTGWTISSNVAGSGSIDVCNGTDMIDVGVQRQIFVRVQGIAIGGPSTISGQLLFSNGSSCIVPGSLNGDNPADNTSTTSITVIAAPSCALTGVTASAGTITCNGGTITLTATATTTGPVTLQYSLNGGSYQSSNTFTVGAGNYIVTAREVATPACTATAPAVTITQPSSVTAPVVGAIIQPTCTVATGSVGLSNLPSGNWTINPGAISGNTATTTINNLPAGTYNFTVTNAAGCTSAVSSDVVINSQPVTPTAPLVGTITQPTCAVSIGSVVLNGLPAGSWLINPGNISGNTASATINNLNPGTFNFTVTNADVCTSPASANVVINDVPGAPPAPIVSITQPSCTVATGIITITSDTSGITFSLDGGSYAPYPAAGYIVAAGNHTLTAKDASSCTSPVDNIIISTQPATPQAPTVSIVQPTCNIATGTITITSDTVGLKFSFDGGTYQIYPPGGYNALPGPHTIVAKNISGCISSITNITVNAQLSPPTASVLSGTIACNGGTTTLTVTASNGAAPYEYSLDGGAFQTGNTFTVSAGIYTVTVKDANLCTATASKTVVQPTAILATASTGAIACNGGLVTLTVSATGGIGTRQYSLNGGAFQLSNAFTVGAGSYTVTVKDANNCTGITPAMTVTQPASLIASATAKRITQCGGKAMVIVTATGGITPYTSGVDTFAKGPGTWTFSVTDSGGCTDTASITIEAPACMDLHVFPNPAKNSITIDHSTSETGAAMQVFDIIGRRMIYQPVPQNVFQTTINVSKLAAGSYVLVYWSGSEKKKILFVKVSSN